MPGKRQLVLCMVLAVVLHAAVLAGWSRPGIPMRIGSGRGRTDDALLQVRVLRASTVDQALRNALAAAPVPKTLPPKPSTPQPQAPGPRKLPAPPVPPASPAPPVVPEQPPSQPEPAASAVVPPQEPNTDIPQTPTEVASFASAAQEGGYAGYIPSTLLDDVPEPLGNVSISTPPGLALQPFLRNQRMVLRLYISETGQVDYVETESSSLPPVSAQVVEQAARAAFMAARFSPGKIKGEPAKSTIEIEVTLDANGS